MSYNVLAYNDIYDNLAGSISESSSLSSICASLVTQYGSSVYEPFNLSIPFIQSYNEAAYNDVDNSYNYSIVDECSSSVVPNSNVNEYTTALSPNLEAYNENAYNDIYNKYNLSAIDTQVSGISLVNNNSIEEYSSITDIPSSVLNILVLVLDSIESSNIQSSVLSVLQSIAESVSTIDYENSTIAYNSVIVESVTTTEISDNNISYSIVFADSAELIDSYYTQIEISNFFLDNVVDTNTQTGILYLSGSSVDSISSVLDYILSFELLDNSNYTSIEVQNNEASELYISLYSTTTLILQDIYDNSLYVYSIVLDNENSTDVSISNVSYISNILDSFNTVNNSLSVKLILDMPSFLLVERKKSNILSECGNGVFLAEKQDTKILVENNNNTILSEKSDNIILVEDQQ